MRVANFSLRKHLLVILGLLISLCLAAKAELYKLSITKLAEAEANIKLEALSETIIDSELSLVGDEFSAMLSPSTARSMGLPRGTRMLGRITSLDRACLIDIDKLQLPDGKQVAAKASISISNDKGLLSSTIHHSVELGAATLVGAVDAIEYGGIATAVMTHGISVGVGAGIGLGMGLAGLTIAKPLRNDSFNLTKMKLISDFELLEPLPLVSDDQLHLAEAYRSKLDKLSQHLASNGSKTNLGLQVKLRDIDKYFSASYGEFIILDFDITNKTARTIYAQDLVLSSAKHLKPVYSNPFIYNDGFIPLQPGEHRLCKLAYALGDYDDSDNYELMLLDSNTDQVLLSYDLESLRASH